MWNIVKKLYFKKLTLKTEKPENLQNTVKKLYLKKVTLKIEKPENLRNTINTMKTRNMWNTKL